MRARSPSSILAACLGGALLLGACTTSPAPSPAPPPPAVAGPPAPSSPPQLPGFDAAITPLTAPLALTYSPARFVGHSMMRVSTGGGPTSSLSIALSGELATVTPERLRATLVTESVAVDGERSDSGVAPLVQEIALGRTGELLGMSSRTAAATEPLPDRHRALEQGWRDRLPQLNPLPVGPGDPIEAADRLLAPLRLMLGGRDVELRTTRPIRTIVVGLAACGAARCLVGRREGGARLTGQRGAIDVDVSGHALLDPATGLFVEERELIRLSEAAGAGPGRELAIAVETSLTRR